MKRQVAVHGKQIAAGVRKPREVGQAVVAVNARDRCRAGPTKEFRPDRLGLALNHGVGVLRRLFGQAARVNPADCLGEE